jgi:hypothetical protein
VGKLLPAIEKGLKGFDPSYSIEDDHLKLGNAVYGAIEINAPGDGLFDEEIEWMLEEVEESEGEGKTKVKRALEQAKAIVALQVLWQGRGTEETMEKLEPLWEWLFANRQGLLQADAEGYYDSSGLILEE